MKRSSVTPSYYTDKISHCSLFGKQFGKDSEVKTYNPFDTESLPPGITYIHMCPKTLTQGHTSIVGMEKD